MFKRTPAATAPAAPAASPMAQPKLTPTQRAMEAFKAEQAKNEAAAQGVAPQSSSPTGELDPSVSKAEIEAKVQKDSIEGTPETVEEPQALETPPVEETKPKEDPLSSQYAVLARKEKAHRLRMQELKAKEDALAAREAAIGQKPSFDESKYISRDRLKTSYMDVLAEEGVSYDEITNSVLNQSQGQQDPATKAAIARLEAQLKSQADALERAQKAAEQNQQDSYKQAVRQITAEVKSIVSNDPAFEMIKETGGVQDVVDLIEATFKEDGVLLSNEEACKQVEDYLFEEAMKLTKLKKIQAKNSVAPSTPKSPAPAQQSQPSKTLTNGIATSKKLSAKERAILAFKGDLK